MARTQKNKATNAHMGLLRAKLSKLRATIITEEGSRGGGGGGQEFEVKSTGDARVGLVGFPSVGKSTLMCKLTNTESAIAAYEFTTVTCVPGIFRYKGAKVQLLDLPGIIEGAKDGKGRGKQVISTVMTCSLICIVLDSTKPLTHKKIIEKELYGFGVRLNKSPPNISVTKRENGGINISQAAGVKLYGLDKDTVSSICKEYRISNASIVFHSSSNADDLIDVLEGSRKYIPCIYVLNKIDAITIEELEILGTHPHYVPISGNKEWNLDILLEKMWAYMNVIRVYTKPKGEIPDYEEPVILPINSTIEDFCRKIHKGLLAEFSFANIWGTSAKYNGQKVGKDHIIEDEDVIQVYKKI